MTTDNMQNIAEHPQIMTDYIRPKGKEQSKRQRIKDQLREQRPKITIFHNEKTKKKRQRVKSLLFNKIAKRERFLKIYFLISFFIFLSFSCSCT